VQLIDVLEKRSDSVRLVEGVEKVEAQYATDVCGWELALDGAVYRISSDAFDTLLNLLRIPIKYIKRCVEEEGVFLAEASLNYWLGKCGGLSFLVAIDDDERVITQVFPGERLYIPGDKINDLILDYLAGTAAVYSYTSEDDIFNAVYITDEIEEIGGATYHYGVRVLYSDCFKITPRFDGVLVGALSGAVFAYPTTGRKFRVSGSTIPQVFDQTEEFLDLSIDGLKGTLVPKLKDLFSEQELLMGAEQFFSRLCSDLRFSRKICNELVRACTSYPNHLLSEIVVSVAVYTSNLPDDSLLNVEMARDIQIAMTNHITRGAFK
jgi:hypothetical protein